MFDIKPLKTPVNLLELLVNLAFHFFPEHLGHPKEIAILRN